MTEARPYLIEEQNELCAYCERRIERDSWVKLQKRGKSELEPQISVNFFSVVKSILQ